MKPLSVKQKVFLIVTIVITIVFIGFAIYAAVIGKIQQSITISASTLLMLGGAFGQLDI